MLHHTVVHIVQIITLGGGGGHILHGLIKGKQKVAEMTLPGKLIFYMQHQLVVFYNFVQALALGPKMAPP